MIKPKRHFRKAVIVQDIYVLSESSSSGDLAFVETYSLKSDNWKTKTQLLYMWYYHHKDKWDFLPDMLFERSDHSAVSMGDKMFIIGGFDQSNYEPPCEVYDKVLDMFSCVQSPGIVYIQEILNQTYCVGNKILLISG